MTPDEARKRRSQDEAITEAGKVMPALWRSLYVNLIQEGFTKSEAMQILIGYIQGMCKASAEEQPPEEPKQDDA